MFRTKAALCASLLLWTPMVYAEDIAQLEQTLQDVAQHSIPRTVLLNVAVGEQKGAGSGAIVSEDGYILTCTHVIEVGQDIEVVTSDGTTYKGTVVGRNVRQDYSLVKIEAQGLPFFEIGDSNTVAPGDWVVALGHPGGPYPDVQPAFAAGKVRGLDAKLPVGMMSKYYNHAIITDAPIFAGDSGGPLVDLDGKLVGINGAIVMINELAFAVPINQIMDTYARLKAGETIEGEQAGQEAFAEMQKLISPEDYQKMMSKAFGNFGKLFGEDSPLGDMFGGGEMPDLSKLFGGEMPDLSELFGGGGNGEMPDMQKMMEQLFGGNGGEMPDLGELFGGGQGGQGMDLQKMMEQLFGGNGGEAPDMQKMMEQLFGGGNGEMPDLGELFGGGQPQPQQPAAPKAFLGVQVDRNARVNGLLVNELVPGSSAEKHGVKKGDVIAAIDGRAVGSFETLIEIMSGKEIGQTVTLEVDRAVFVDTVLVTKRLQLEVTLGARPE
jgi:S1-C subfamily serine protease